MVQQVLRQAESAVALYASPDKRGVATPLGCPACSNRLMHEAGARQRSPVGLRPRFDRVRSRPAHLAVLSGLLDGSATVGGLKVDTDLRWSILRRLVAVGHAGTEQIEAELSRDDTAAGRLNAATCRAAIPTAQAKAEAWNACLNDTSLPNHMLGATVVGITLPEHRELLRPHVDQYFEALPAVWRDRTNEIAQEITMACTRTLWWRPPQWNAPMRRSTAMSTSRTARDACWPRAGTACCGRCDASRRTPNSRPVRAHSESG